MRHAVTFLCLVAAIALYVAGSAPGAAGLILAGLLAEGVFWFRLFRRKGRAKGG